MPANCNAVLKPKSRLVEPLSRLAALCISAVLVFYGQDAAAAKPPAVPTAAATPAAAVDILEIQAFRLKVGYDDDWLQSRPHVSDGLLVVLKVDPGLVVPRNAAEPVLYAGDRTVQRLNQGDHSGFVIGIIPGDIDLTSEPIWFGRPQLPERVTPEVIKEERALADGAGIKPFNADKIKSAQRDPIDAEDLAALLRGAAGELVLKYSPDEKELVDTWRLSATGSTIPR